MEWKRDERLTLRPEELQREWVVEARALHDVGDRPDVIFVSPRGAVGANFHLVADDLVGQRFAICKRPRSRARQPEVERVDAQGFH